MFNSQKFLKELGQDLVSEFTRGGYGTTPGLIGAARETAVRNRLAKLLPKIVSVGSGCIIDSYGCTSKQQDIVIYESNQCPIFSISDSAEATYYPCEGVIAVGEVKSTLSRKELEDSFKKMESVKQLRRYTESTLNWRKYGVNTGIVGAESESFSQTGKITDQVFGFIICRNLGLKTETFLEAYRDLSKNIEPHLRPNICISLEDGIVLQIEDTPSQRTVNWDSYDSTGIVLAGVEESNFQYLLARLGWQINNGRTSSVLPFQRYVLKHDLSMKVLGEITY